MSNAESEVYRALKSAYSSRIEAELNKVTMSGKNPLNSAFGIIHSSAIGQFQQLRKATELTTINASDEAFLVTGDRRVMVEHFERISGKEGTLDTDRNAVPLFVQVGGELFAEMLQFEATGNAGEA